MSLTRFRLFSVCTLLALLCPFLVNAQSSYISPYSRYGVGDLNNQNGIQSFSMGQTGNALNPWAIRETGKQRYIDPVTHDTLTRYIYLMDTLTPYFINLKNPASYYYNRITTFEAGLLSNNYSFSTGGQTSKNSNGYFAYFAIAFPVSKHFSASLGLRPMTNVGYNITTTPTIDSIGTVNNQYQGSGGINSAYLGIAYSPCRNLSFGINISYLFGDLTNTQNVLYPPNINAFNSQVTENTDIRSLYLNYGLMYSFRLTRSWYVTIGATAALASNLNATYSLLSVSEVGTTPQTNIDTIQDSSVKGKIRLPLMYGVGITLKKGDKWTFTFDYDVQNWSQYSFFGQSQNLADSKQMGLGIQYIPKRNFGTFFQRVHYRAGFTYNQTYLDINNTQLNDMALTFGIGMPVGGNNVMMRTSMINLGFQIGQMGTTSNNLLQEDYIKIMLGFTFDDRWFVKRRFE